MCHLCFLYDLWTVLYDIILLNCCRLWVRVPNAFYALRGCLGPTMEWASNCLRVNFDLVFFQGYPRIQTPKDPRFSGILHLMPPETNC